MPNSTTSPNPTTSLSVAQGRINYWRQDQQTLQSNLRTSNPDLCNLPPLTIKAFTFYLDDLRLLLHRIHYYNSNFDPNHSYGLRAAVNVPSINAVRLYPGNAAQTVPAAPNVGCLMAVGVTEFHPDYNTGGNDVTNLNIPNQTGIYDISHPCPPLVPQNSLMNQPADVPVGPQYTISLADAKQRIAYWQGDQVTIKPYVTLSNSPVLNIQSAAFNIDDLQNMLTSIDVYNGLPPVLPPPVTNGTPINGVRFYFGKKVEIGLPVAPYSCLVAVPVTGFVPNTNSGGNDIIALPPLPQQNGPNPLPPVSAIYDFSYPCPTTCPNPMQGIMDAQ